MSSSNELPNFAKKLLESTARDNGFRDYSVQIKSGSQAGDGFASEIFSIAITENKSEKRLDLVCKVAPLNKNKRKEFMAEVVFDREASLYDKLMPIFAQFQKEKNVPEADQFLSYPKCYATIADIESEHFAIILEDLRPQGYRMWSKVKPSPIENVRLAMRELGKFHGLSVAMKDQRPQEFAEFKKMKDILKTAIQSENILNMFTSTFDRASSSLKSEDHKNIMRHIKDNITKYLDDCLNDEEADQFGVLCHGIFSLLTFNSDLICSYHKL